MVMRCSGSLSDIWLTMAVECSTDPAYNHFWTVIKDFGTVIGSLLSFGLAFWVSRITKRQKEINERTYNLNLFKERFAVWNEFQAKKDIIIHLRKIFLFNRYKDNSNEFKKFKKSVSEVETLLKKIKFLFITKNVPEKYNDTVCYIEYNTNIIKNSDKYREFNDHIQLLECGFSPNHEDKILFSRNERDKILKKSNLKNNIIENTGEIITEDETFFNNVNDLMQYYLKLDE